MAGEMRFPTTARDWELGASDALSLATPMEFDIPFASFAKTERLGRIADWTGVDGGAHSIGIHRARARTMIKTAADEEDAGWSFTADTKGAARDKKLLPGTLARGPVTGGQYGGRQGGGGGGAQQAQRGGRGARRGGGWGPRFADRHTQRKREPSVVVSAEWKILEEIEFSRLAKLQLDPDDSVPIKTVGRAPIYDRAFDKVSTRAEKTFSLPADEPIRHVLQGVEDDATLLKLASENGATVIVPDYVASILMAAPRTVNPWDISVKRRGNLVIFDKRPESDLDLMPVNETAPEAPMDDRSETNINSAHLLAQEMAWITHHLPKVILKSGVESEEKAVRYATLDLGDEAVVLVRSLIPMLLSENIPTHLATMLEYEQKGAGGMDWRMKLDSQRGAIFAHEIRNNGALLARTVFQALVSAVDHIKLAYVSRAGPKDTVRHSLLGLHEFEPYELASQMNLNIPAGFGILRAIIDLCRSLPTNRDYILMRDPNKAVLRLYKLPGGDSNATDDAIDELIPATAAIHISESSDMSDSD
jgi:translation initiation factor 3 subunit D